MLQQIEPVNSIITAQKIKVMYRMPDTMAASTQRSEKERLTLCVVREGGFQEIKRANESDWHADDWHNVDYGHGPLQLRSVSVENARCHVTPPENIVELVGNDSDQDETERQGCHPEGVVVQVVVEVAFHEDRHSNQAQQSDQVQSEGLDPEEENLKSEQAC
jgi:hypothetical protein